MEKTEVSKDALRDFSRRVRWCYAQSALLDFFVFAGAIFSPFAVFCFIAVNFSGSWGPIALVAACLGGALCALCVVKFWRKGWLRFRFGDSLMVSCPCCGSSGIKIRIVCGFMPRRTAVCRCPDCGFSHSVVIN